MKSIALVAVSLVFVLQTAPSRAEEICSDGRTIRQQCEYLNAVYLYEHQTSELERIDRQCRISAVSDEQPLELSILGCMDVMRRISEMSPPSVPDCAQAVECE